MGKILLFAHFLSYNLDVPSISTYSLTTMPASSTTSHNFLAYPTTNEPPPPLLRPFTSAVRSFSHSIAACHRLYFTNPQNVSSIVNRGPINVRSSLEKTNKTWVVLLRVVTHRSGRQPATNPTPIISWIATISSHLNCRQSPPTSVSYLSRRDHRGDHLGH